MVQAQEAGVALRADKNAMDGRPCVTGAKQTRGLCKAPPRAGQQQAQHVRRCPGANQPSAGEALLASNSGCSAVGARPSPADSAASSLKEARVHSSKYASHAARKPSCA